MREILKKDKGYALRYIQGVPYLIPIGQMNANFRGDIRLNETGALIWNFLDQKLTQAEVAEKCVEYYECDESPEGQKLAAQIREVCEKFANSLLQRGVAYLVQEDMIEKPSSFGSGRTVWERIDEAYPDFENDPEVKVKKNYEIAGIGMNIISDTEHIPDELAQFESNFAIMYSEGSDSVSRPVQNISIKKKRVFSVEQSGTVLDSNDLWVSLLPGGYLLQPNILKNIDYAIINEDGSRAEIFYSEVEDEPFDEAVFKSELFETLGFCYQFYAQQFGRISVHSASILYNNKAWMFSGPSGRGKSTHTAIWRKLYNVEMVNGDVNCITVDENGTVVNGLPWCGTSGISTAEDHPAGGIVFLEWADTDSIREMNYTEKVLFTLHRLITPMWTEKQLDMNLEFAEKIAGTIPMCVLKCTMKDSAAETVKNWIDAL